MAKKRRSSKRHKRHKRHQLRNKDQRQEETKNDSNMTIDELKTGVITENPTKVCPKKSTVENGCPISKIGNSQNEGNNKNVKNEKHKNSQSENSKNTKENTKSFQKYLSKDTQASYSESAISFVDFDSKSVKSSRISLNSNGQSTRSFHLFDSSHANLAIDQSLASISFSRSKIVLEKTSLQSLSLGRKLLISCRSRVSSDKRILKRKLSCSEISLNSRTIKSKVANLGGKEIVFNSGKVLWSRNSRFFVQFRQLLHEKFSMRLIVKHLLDFCSWLGLNLRTSSLIENAPIPPKIQGSTSTLQAPPIFKCSTCAENKLEILNLKLQIDDLRNDLKTLQLEESSKFDSLNAQILDLKTIVHALIGTTPKPAPKGVANNIPPPPPPPPPLSLPLPLSASLCQSPKDGRDSKKRGENKAGENEEKANTRPIISVDDILKVKLKKAKDRNETKTLLSPNCSTSPLPSSPSEVHGLTAINKRPNTQPVISIDMLKEVKLRPASRTLANAHLPHPMEMPTGSLTSILKRCESQASKMGA